MSPLMTMDATKNEGSASRSWLRALELTASIPRNRHRLLPTVIEELAAHSGDAAALLSDSECLTYRELAARTNQYAHWAIEQGLEKGDVVGLLMPNRPEYVAIWLGISSVGVVVALLNTHLAGPSLAHCIRIANPKCLIVAEEFFDSIQTALPHLETPPKICIRGAQRPHFPSIDDEIRRQPCEKPDGSGRPSVTVDDRALYIYTSGTTGLPKAANVSHARVLQWSQWFAGMMGLSASDRMYNCLPMYHSIGGVLVPGAALAGGGAVVISEKFSASRFWSDIVRWDCTIFQYIGEFCRYLLHVSPAPDETAHRLRLACGNGLAPDVWDAFKERFRIPRILEFYASTEGGVSLFNAEGKPGAIGRIPSYLAHRFAPALVYFDHEKGEPVRNEEGLCVRAAANEPGEAIGRIDSDPAHIGAKFEGYTDDKASGRKILRDVFEHGDMWVRTGDLMRRDERGFFYFVDRVGDTFRWKGENVATTEVGEVLCAFPGVKHAIVYGVTIPGADGRAGMAALTTDGKIDLAELRKHLIERLPAYARPIFLRFKDDIEVTGTFKYSRTELVREAFDPCATEDVIYFDNPESQSFERLDRALYERIRSRQIRL